MAMATETLKKIWLRVKNIQTYFFIHIREDFELEKKKMDQRGSIYLKILSFTVLTIPVMLLPLMFDALVV